MSIHLWNDATDRVERLRLAIGPRESKRHLVGEARYLFLTGQQRGGRKYEEIGYGVSDHVSGTFGPPR